MPEYFLVIILSRTTDTPQIVQDRMAIFTCPDHQEREHVDILERPFIILCHKPSSKLNPCRFLSIELKLLVFTTSILKFLSIGLHANFLNLLLFLKEFRNIFLVFIRD